MEDKFNNLIRKVKKSKMTAVEKTRVKLSIMTALESRLRKDETVISPYSKVSPYLSDVPRISRFSFHSFSKITFVSVFTLILAAGGLSFASANALPGDYLYPIKINLKENIEEKLTFAPKEKIALRQQRIEDRFTEVETLIKEKRITPASRSIAESEIQLEKEKISEGIEEINKENPEAAAEAKLELESSINERREQIDTRIEENKDIESIEQDLAELEATLDATLETGLLETPITEEVPTEETTVEEIPTDTEEPKEDPKDTTDSSLPIEEKVELDKEI